MLREWASAHPAEALKSIEDERFQNLTASLAYGAIMGDPGIATAVMQAMDDHGERASVLLSANAQGSNHVFDLFPVPGQPNRLPNFRERYECLLEAVEAGSFRPGQKRAQLSSLYQEFRHKLPGVQQAFEAMTE